MALYERAVRSDPTNFQYQLHYENALAARVSPTEAHAALVRLVTGDSRKCRQLVDAGAWDALAAEWRTSSARTCIAYYFTGAAKAPSALAPEITRELERARLPLHYTMRASELVRAGRPNDAFALLRRGLQHALHPRDRIMIAAALANLLRSEKRVREAADVDRDLLAAVRRSPPAVPTWYALWKIDGLSGAAIDTVTREAAVIAQRHGAWGDCAYTLYVGGGRHVDRGDPARAVRLLNEALSCAERAAPYFRAIVGVKLGRAHLKAGDYSAAIAVLQRALPFTRETGTPYYTSEALHNIAHAYEGAGDWERARAAAQGFVAEAEKLERSSQRIISLRDAGIIYWNSDEGVAARRYFDRMVRLVDAEQHEFHWAAEYFERLGDLQRARTYYRKALHEPGDSARKFAGLTRVYLALNETDSAEVTARLHDAAHQTPEEVPLLPEVLMRRGKAALAIRGSLEYAKRQAARRNLIGAANAYSQAGALAFGAGRFREAERAAAAALPMARRVNSAPAIARALTLQAAAQSAVGRPAAADRTFRELMPAARRAAEPVLLADAYLVLGAARALRGDLAGALVAFDSANAFRARVVDRFEDRFDRVRFATPFASAFDDAFAAVLLRGDAARSHDWLQRRRARGGGARKHPSLVQLAATLGPDQAFIDFVVLPTFTGAIATTRDASVIFRAKLSRAQLAALVNRIRAPMTPAFGRVDFTRVRYDYDAARELYRELLFPLEAVIGRKAEWLIAADDMLQLVPFDALVVNGREARPRMVLDEHVVTNVVSAAAVGRAPRAKLGTITIVTTDAPGSAAEAVRVQRRAQARVLAAATEPAVAAALATSSVAHFAVHGVADVEQPLLSHLRVAAGGGDDGYLHISEIARMRTRADLVVLTACETANARLYGGDGALSVARSFLAAGARAVIATHWSVGPNALDFSDELYAALARGLTPAQAVRAAKLAMRDGGGADPAQWAPFVLLHGGS